MPYNIIDTIEYQPEKFKDFYDITSGYTSWRFDNGGITPAVGTIIDLDSYMVRTIDLDSYMDGEE